MVAEKQECVEQWDYFISYDSQDRAEVQAIVADIRRTCPKRRLWVDWEQVQPGDVLTVNIETGLHCSKSFIVMLGWHPPTEGVLDSGQHKYQPGEIAMILALSKVRGGGVIPFVLLDREDVDPSGEFLPPKVDHRLYTYVRVDARRNVLQKHIELVCGAHVNARGIFSSELAALASPFRRVPGQLRRWTLVEAMLAGLILAAAAALVYGMASLAAVFMSPNSAAKADRYIHDGHYDTALSLIGWYDYFPASPEPRQLMAFGRARADYGTALKNNEPGKYEPEWFGLAALSLAQNTFDETHPYFPARKAYDDLLTPFKASAASGSDGSDSTDETHSLALAVDMLNQVASLRTWLDNGVADTPPAPGALEGIFVITPSPQPEKPPAEWACENIFSHMLSMALDRLGPRFSTPPKLPPDWSAVSIHSLLNIFENDPPMREREIQIALARRLGARHIVVCSIGDALNIQVINTETGADLPAITRPLEGSAADFFAATAKDIQEKMEAAEHGKP